MMYMIQTKNNKKFHLWQNL